MPSIADVVSRLNDDYFLPTIQREFVWLNNNECKIEKLFDSIMQEYPIGNIIVWSKVIEDSLASNIEVYKFLEKYEFYKENNNDIGSNISNIRTAYLVLDGQQRLTALNLGLRGHLISNNKTSKLYLNLFSNIESDDENNDYNLKYEFKFLTENNARKIDENNLWLEVGRVLSFSDATSPEYKSYVIKDLKSVLDNYPDKVLKVENTLMQLHNILVKDNEYLKIHEVKTKDEDKVLNIFVRTNDGGVKLEKADLLLSFMESNKEIFQHDIDNKGARKQIISFVNEINEERVNKPNFRIAKDDVLKACLVLTDLEPRYSIRNFNSEHLTIINNNWNSIKNSYRSTIELISRYGFQKQNITSKNALIPIAYFLKNTNLGASFVDSREDQDLQLKAQIFNWLINSLLKQSFGRASDSTLKKVRDHLNKYKSFSNAVFGQEITEEDILRIINKEKYQSKYSHLILMLMTDEKYWDKSHQDHIFPRSKFEKDFLLTHGIPIDKHNEYIRKADSIANLQLLSPALNISKSDENALDWFNKQNKAFKQLMLIPEGITLSWDNFLEFTEEREKLILEILKIKLNVRELATN